MNLPGTAKVGAALVITIVGLAVIVPLLSPYASDAQAAIPFAAPSPANLFGADQLGRDVFTRTFAAARLDLVMAAIGVAIPFLVGTALGGVAGAIAPRAFDATLQLIIDSINAFPFLVLAMAVLAIVGPGVGGVLIAICCTNWARYARLARARALTLRRSGFVEATRLLGYPRIRVLVRHIFPNVFDETLAYALSDFVIVVLVVAGLSYLGLGVRPPAPEWGAMMAEGQLYLRVQWWLTIMPGVVLAVTSLGVTLVARAYQGRIAA